MPMISLGGVHNLLQGLRKDLDGVSITQTFHQPYRRSSERSEIYT